MSQSAPQLVPETFVLELAQNNADIIHNQQNGDYTVNFAEPLRINTGDSLAMRMASIDSQKSDSQSIVFANDQHLNINFSYYDSNYPIQDASFADILTRRPINTPAGTYAPDFKLYTSYTEAGNIQLDSIQISYTGSEPYYPDPDKDFSKTGKVFPGNVDKFPFEGTCKLLSYYCFPQLAWTDADGVSRQTPAVPFTLKQTSKTAGAYERTIVTCTASNSTDPNWAYCYGSVTPIADPGTTWQVPQKDATPGAKLLGVTIGNGTKIIAREGSLKVTGVESGYIIQLFTESTGVAGSSTDQHFDPVTSFDVGAESTTTIPTAHPFQIMRRSATTVIPAGRYDRNTLANLMTRDFTQVGIKDVLNAGGTSQTFQPNSDLVLNTDSINNQDLVFHKIPDASSGGADLYIDISSTNAYTYLGSGKAVQCGARKFAIEYGEIGATFQVSDAHQSCENPADVGKENVGFFRSGTGAPGTPYVFNQVDSATGIIVHDLAPRELWDDVMGLYDKWVVPLSVDPSGIEYYTNADIVGKFPRESAEIVTFDPTNSRVDLTPTLEAKFVDTTGTSTFAVIGDSPQVNVEGSYYLIEITGLNVAQSNLIDNDGNRPNISAIVSKQYDANDIVTGFADSAIPYTHRGVPTLLNSARVRILDPDTKEVVSTLGDRNTVFLQLNTARPVYQPKGELPPKVPAPKTQTR